MAPCDEAVPDRRGQVRERLYKLVQVNVGFDSEGSKIVIYQPEQD